MSPQQCPFLGGLSHSPCCAVIRWGPSLSSCVWRPCSPSLGHGLKEFGRPSTEHWRSPFATALGHIMIKGLKLHCAFSYENSYINRQVLLVLQGFVGYAKLMLFGHHQSPRSGWFRQLLVFFGFSTTELLSSLFIEGLYEQQMFVKTSSSGLSGASRQSFPSWGRSSTGSLTWLCIFCYKGVGRPSLLSAGKPLAAACLFLVSWPALQLEIPQG